MPFADDPLQPICLTNPEHIDRIEAILENDRPSLVVIDSLRGSHSDDENSSRVSAVLQTLAALAEQSGVAFVVVHHTRKMHRDETIDANSSRGSNAITALARSQLAIDKPDPNSDWCRVRVLKENLGLKPQPVGFLITATGLQFGQAPAKPRTETAKDRARQFLEANMRAGVWYSAKSLLQDAEQNGLSPESIHARKNRWALRCRTTSERSKAGGSGDCQGEPTFRQDSTPF